MLLLLPPSETKRDGGDGAVVLDLGALVASALTPQRAELVDRRVSRSRRRGRRRCAALKLGPRQAARGRTEPRLLDAPTMPAIDRYTGVLFDALDAPTS